MMKLPLISMAFAFAVSAGTASAAGNCDALRSQIQAKIAASGVADSTVTIVDAGSASGTGGKVVGSCDLGAKSITYQQLNTSASPAAVGPTTLAAGTAPSSARPKKDAILTECKNGSVSASGDCKN